MTELEKMERAKMYIEKLANGINPLDNISIPENDIVNNVRISRCLFYVLELLGKAVERERKAEQKKIKKEKFNIDFETIQKFSFSDKPLPVSEIVERINSLIDTERMKKISYKHITEWLVSIDMLTVEVKPDGKTAKRPTESGREIGITTEERYSMYGNYTAVVYNRNAQEFIIDNIEAVMDMMNKK